MFLPNQCRKIFVASALKVCYAFFNQVCGSRLEKNISRILNGLIIQFADAHDYPSRLCCSQCRSGILSQSQGNHGNG